MRDGRDPRANITSSISLEVTHARRLREASAVLEGVPLCWGQRSDRWKVVWEPIMTEVGDRRHFVGTTAGYEGKGSTARSREIETSSTRLEEEGSSPIIFASKDGQNDRSEQILT
jgi:hypothetical protein